MSTPLRLSNSFTPAPHHASNCDETDKPCFHTWEKGRIDEAGCLCISSLASRESDSTALGEMFQDKTNVHEAELEAAMRETEESCKAREEEEI